MESDEAGLCLLDDPAHRVAAHVQSSSNTTSDSLADEYFRDVAAGKPIAPPQQLFSRRTIRPRQPENRWRSHAHLLFGNWINEIYQTTPFNPAAIGLGETRR